MTLGERIKQYLDEHEMSMRSFSSASGLSTAYISMLINGRKNGSFPVPTLETYAAAAHAMGVTPEALLASVNDIISIDHEQPKPLELSSTQQELIQMMGRLSEDDQRKLLRIVRAAFPTEGD